MPLSRLTTDVFGVVTISLVSLFAVFGLFCIYRSIYFWFRIQRRDFRQLGYFNGPWITRITLILVTLWWSFGEIVRLNFLKGNSRLFTSLQWQNNVCKFYIVSNLGFAEPGIFLVLVFLLHASLQKRESGALSRWWNRKTIGYILFFCLPIFMVQLGVVLVGPKLVIEEKSKERTKLSKYLTSTSSLIKDSNVCTYPLMSTIFLGLFDALLISYVLYVGARLLSLVINKGLRQRVHLLVSFIILFLPLRVLLLGFSVLPHPGNVVHETIVFLAFFTVLCCVTVGVFMLVFWPVADSLALKDIEHIEMEGMPYDDYFDGASLIANQNHHEIGRNSDASTKRGSISFRTMIRDDLPAPNGLEASFCAAPRALNIVSPAGQDLLSSMAG